jgi:hypothetical protein
VVSGAGCGALIGATEEAPRILLRFELASFDQAYTGLCAIPQGKCVPRLSAWMGAAHAQGLAIH